MTRAVPVATGDVDVVEPMSTTEASTYQRLRCHLATLKLGAAAEALTTVLDTARTQQLSTIAAMERLLAIEVQVTKHRRLAGRLRFACLPAPWSLSDFDFTAQPGIDEKLIRDLATLRFLDDAGNILFVGPPGTGKTMLAIGLARAAVDAGHRVYFTTAEDLATRCKKAAAQGRWASTMRFSCGPRLLVIDEFAYARQHPDPDANAALFEVISRRYLKTSTILTSHTGVASWGERLSDPMLAAAILDRLLHRGIVVAIDGPSYRMRAHQQRTQALRRALHPGGQPRPNAPASPAVSRSPSLLATPTGGFVRHAAASLTGTPATTVHPTPATPYRATFPTPATPLPTPYPPIPNWPTALRPPTGLNAARTATTNSPSSP